MKIKLEIMALPDLWFKTYQKARNRKSTWLELAELRDISLPYHRQAGRAEIIKD
ncbi:hypothetical protein [Moorena sp. SIO3B2]|uniref:hypothetical protein n=1 Tax=Moorena sp. SIO3B2 TaxID=2607827 RepID=UPI0013CC292F|nr:hypothetical protein [Moorena sp. SIO3B2]NEP31749.1 hypothetical protein [Moorena sp. SIO3B2]NEP31774.1 hypothetical protein [Moorena sp. SIO3B2]